jgi:hypothetical protein
MKYDSEIDQILLTKEGEMIENVKCHDGFYKIYE